MFLCSVISYSIDSWLTCVSETPSKLFIDTDTDPLRNVCIYAGGNPYMNDRGSYTVLLAFLGWFKQPIVNGAYLLVRYIPKLNLRLKREYGVLRKASYVFKLADGRIIPSVWVMHVRLYKDVYLCPSLHLPLYPLYLPIW